MYMFKKYMKNLANSHFDQNRDKIRKENRAGLELILMFYAAILCLNVVGMLVSGSNLLHRNMLMAQVIVICAAIIFYHFFLKKKNADFTLWIYLIETPVLLVTMLSGMINRPETATFTFFVYLLLFPLLILDKPWRIDLYIVVMGVVYALLDPMFKDQSVWSRDYVHLINIMLIAIAASAYFLIFRIRNIEYAKYFAQIADEDPLTGLYNRSGARHHINPTNPGVFIYIDLDRFKGVNDHYGHEAGDNVIRDTADVLRNNFRRDDILIRLGGDEFAVYAPGKWDHHHVEAKLSQLLSSIHHMIPDDSTMSGEYTRMTASIGCAYAPNGCDTLEHMIRVADEAMYRAKKGGKDEYCIEEM